MKRTAALLLCLALAFLAGCGLFNDDVSKERILAYVRENVELLEAAPIDEIAGYQNDVLRDHLGSSTIVKQVSRYDGGIVEFYCGGTGLSVSSTYSGFYYSPEDAPFGFEFDHRVVWEQTGGDSWFWTKDGDSVTVERILPHWFYYHIVWP